MSILADRIQKILDDTGARKIDLADTAGVTKSTATQWTTGQVKSMKYEYALKIAARWGYSPDWIVLGEGDPQLKKGSYKRLDESGAQSDDWPFSFSKEEVSSLPPEQKALLETLIHTALSAFKLKPSESGKTRIYRKGIAKPSK
jgi:transcriptional regulator with XRE-family HTH domain